MRTFDISQLRKLNYPIKMFDLMTFAFVEPNGELLLSAQDAEVLASDCDVK